MPRRTPIACFVGMCIAAVSVATVASATTGEGTGLPQPRVNVAIADGKPFTGRFAITEIDRRARISSGQVAIEYTHTRRPFLLGNLALYGYDEDGRQSNSSSLAYPFSYADGTLRAMIISQGSYVRLGATSFRTTSDPDRLTGTLRWGDGDYAIAYERVPEGSTPGNLPQAKQTTAPPPKLTKSGFAAKNSDYYGRWRLIPSRQDAGATSGVYAPLVRAAASLADDSLVPDSGVLHLFEVESRVAPPTPGAMITLHAPGATRAEFLTDFRWGGPWRTAVVRGGSGEGPVVGRFVARLEDDRLVGTLTNGDLSIDLTFKKP